MTITDESLADTKYEHGTRVCYVKDKCRCDPCRGANAFYKRNKVADNKSLTASSVTAFNEAGLDPALPQLTHGLCSTYEWWGCRCDDCKEAVRLRRKRNRDLASVA